MLRKRKLLWLSKAMNKNTSHGKLFICYRSDSKTKYKSWSWKLLNNAMWTCLRQWECTSSKAVHTFLYQSKNGVPICGLTITGTIEWAKAYLNAFWGCLEQKESLRRKESLLLVYCRRLSPQPLTWQQHLFLTCLLCNLL